MLVCVFVCVPGPAQSGHVMTDENGTSKRSGVVQFENLWKVCLQQENLWLMVCVCVFRQWLKWQASVEERPLQGIWLRALLVVRGTQEGQGDEWKNVGHEANVCGCGQV